MFGRLSDYIQYFPNQHYGGCAVLRSVKNTWDDGTAVSLTLGFVLLSGFYAKNVTFDMEKSRRREFAVIQSVGMTKKRLCGMLVYEGLFYAAITLAVSYPLSAAADGVSSNNYKIIIRKANFQRNNC